MMRYSFALLSVFELPDFRVCRSLVVIPAVLFIWCGYLELDVF